MGAVFGKPRQPERAPPPPPPALSPAQEAQLSLKRLRDRNLKFQSRLVREVGVLTVKAKAAAVEGNKSIALT